MLQSMGFQRVGHDLSTEQQLCSVDAIHNCVRSYFPISTYSLKWALRSLCPATRLQEPALPASSLALTPGPGFTCQWVGSSPRVFNTLTLPTSEPALARGPLRVPQPDTSYQALLNSSQQHSHEAESDNQPD